MTVKRATVGGLFLLICLTCLAAGYAIGYRQGLLQMSAYDLSVDGIIAVRLRHGDAVKARELAEGSMEMRAGTFMDATAKNTVMFAWRSMTFSPRTYLAMAADYVNTYPDAKIHHRVAAFLKSKIPKQTYDETADGSKQNAEALNVAMKEHRRVLLQFGANRCGPCHQLHKIFETDTKVTAVLRKHFVVVMVDVHENRGNTGKIEEWHNGSLFKKYCPTYQGVPLS
jgi:thiol-disulfide isomerase/thioredoxin